MSAPLNLEVPEYDFNDSENKVCSRYQMKICPILTLSSLLSVKLLVQ